MTSENAQEPGEQSRRLRACLKCNIAFDSAWAGERICVRCKSTTAWRSGGYLEAGNSRPRSTRTGRS